MKSSLKELEEALKIVNELLTRTGPTAAQLPRSHPAAQKWMAINTLLEAVEGMPREIGDARVALRRARAIIGLIEAVGGSSPNVALVAIVAICSQLDSTPPKTLTEQAGKQLDGLREHLKTCQAGPRCGMNVEARICGQLADLVRDWSTEAPPAS